MKEWKKIPDSIMQDMKPCSKVYGEYERVKNFEKEVLARPDAQAYIRQMVEKNKQEIEAAEKAKIELWKEAKYGEAGYQSAISAQLYGLAPEKKTTWGQTVMSDTTRDPQAPAQWLAGWYYGIAQEDKRDDILKCYKASDDLTNDLYQAMEAYIAGDTKTGDEKMADTKPLFKTAMSDCSAEITDGLNKVYQKVQDEMDRPDWNKIAQKIYKDFKVMIDRDLDLEFREWKQGVPFNSGMFAGMINQIFLDNAPEPTPELLTNRDDQAPAQFIAGWYYGLTTHDKREKVLDCFEQNPHLTNNLYDAMDAYAKGDTKTGDERMAHARPLWKKSLKNCSALDDHMFGKWAERIDEMMERSDWQQFAEKVYKENKAVIDRDVKLEMREWEQGVFFNSGMFAGQIQKIFYDGQDKKFFLDRNSAPTKFVAGWWYGVSGQDQSDYFPSCFKENDDLTNLMFDAFAAFQTGDTKTGDEKMA